MREIIQPLIPFHIQATRLCHQQVSQHNCAVPADLVAHMAALQAQDFLGAKWSVGLRIPGSTSDGIEEALSRGEIIRTWVMRGTLHLMAAADVRWITDLVAPRLRAQHAGYYKRQELDAKTLATCASVITKALETHGDLTRDELVAELERHHIHAGGQRANFILLRCALDKHICLGQRRGKEFTYTLFDRWVPKGTALSHEEALHRLALRFFDSRGPATLQDFSRWSGFTLRDAKLAIQSLGKTLQSYTAGDQTIFLTTRSTPIQKAPAGVFLLPGFDEYLLSYKDRYDGLTQEQVKSVTGTGNGILSPTILIHGRIAGTWKRQLSSKTVSIGIQPFRRLNTTELQAVRFAAEAYSKYVELPLDASF